MTQLTVNGNSGDLTMSSREIMQLTGKRHTDVKRDICVMLEALDRDVSSFAHTYFDSINRKQVEYRLDRELTETLVTGYSIPLRHKVIKRLHELERELGKAKVPAWISTLTPQAKIAIEDLNSQVDHYKSETTRLNTVCNDLALNLREGMTIPAFCRPLNGINVNRVQSSLVSRKRLLKTAHGYRSASAYRDRLFTERRDWTTEGILTEQVILTLQGAKWLYSEYEKGRLEMKKDWNGQFSHILFEKSEVAA